MVSFERFDNMCDLRLKPKILRNVLSEYVPNEKQPLTDFQLIPKAVSSIFTHKLLSETPLVSIDQKLQAQWKSAVDDWVDRLLALISSSMPDKCWVGVSLMGITCKECSTDRFVSSYSAWFNSLLSHLKNPTSSRIVRVASCISISDLLGRLSIISNTKKDAVSHAAKVILPIIKILDEDSSEALWEGIVRLLTTIVIWFPAAFQSNYGKVEASIASKIFSAKTSSYMLKKFAHFLALLPKAKGDESSWSLMIQKLLISINVHLNNFFQGLEEETKGTKAIQRLAPPGKDAPLPLGGQNGGLDDTAWNSEKLIVTRVSALMFCTSTMLTSSYKSKVNVPVGSLLSLVERMLAVNGSPPRAMSPFMTGIQQELVCAELPTLHSSALELLRATIQGIRSQLLPYAPSVVGLVSNYFRKCRLPVLRIKLYSITTTLLKSMGVAIAKQLAQDVVTNASVDLDPTSVEGFDVVSSKTLSLTNRGPLQACSKKRKHSTNSGVVTDSSIFEVGVPHNHSSSLISLKIAAVEALETLLTIGGALGSDSWRERVDNILMTTATNACEGRWAAAESSSDLAVFQLAALRAFLASLVSPSRVRPAFLAEGLELFQTGKLKAETQVVESCAHALMSLEVVIHPRALPLDGLLSLSKGFPESNSLASQKYNTLGLNKLNGIAQDGDDLCNRWLDVPSSTEIQRTVDTNFPLQETKRKKLGNDLATVVSLSVQDHAVTVASESVQQADVLEEVLETTEEESQRHVSDKDNMAPKDGYREVVSGSQGVEDFAVKDSIMEEATVGKKRESLDESDNESVPSVQEDDFLSSDSDIES